MKLVDIKDLKSFEVNPHEGSTPSSGTNLYRYEQIEKSFLALVNTLRPYKSAWVQKVLDNAMLRYKYLERYK